MPLPEKIRNAPELQQGLGFYFTAFLELSSCRAIGMGTGPVPWLAIQKYSEVYDIQGEQKEDLVHHIQLLDTVYLEWESKREKK
jgi:hypothetical protein